MEAVSWGELALELNDSVDEAVSAVTLKSCCDKLSPRRVRGVRGSEKLRRLGTEATSRSEGPLGMVLHSAGVSLEGVMTSCNSKEHGTGGARQGVGAEGNSRLTTGRSGNDKT